MFTSQGSAAAFDGFLSNPGWIKFPNGLILEWGIIQDVTFNGMHYYTINFPKQLPHTVVSANASAIIANASYNGIAAAYVENVTNDQITVASDEYSTSYSGKISWMVIGY